MAIKLPGVEYIPKVNLAASNISISSEYKRLLGETQNLLLIDVDLTMQNMRKSTALTTIQRQFSLIKLSANVNHLNTVPLQTVLNNSEYNEAQSVDLIYSVDNSEEIPIFNLNLIIKKMKIEFLSQALDQYLAFLIPAILDDI